MSQKDAIGGDKVCTSCNNISVYNPAYCRNTSYNKGSKMRVGYLTKGLKTPRDKQSLPKLEQ